MSDLTAEAALAAARFLDVKSGSALPLTSKMLRDEADRLEAAARTPGQVAKYAVERSTSTVWGAAWEEAAAAVIAHHVGPDRVVVERDAAGVAEGLLRHRGFTTAADRFREALS